LSPLAVEVLDLADLVRVVVEQQGVLLLKVVAEVVTLQDTVELAQELERILDVGDVLEVRVDVVLQLSLNSGDIGLELDEITVECVVVELKELVVLLLEASDGRVEGLGDRGNVLQVVLLEGLELLDGAEELHELANTAAEQIELAEDLGRVEVELLALGELLEAGLGELVLLDVSIMEVNAGLQHNDELIWRVVVVVPETRVIDGLGLLASLDLLGEGADRAEA
jgi:hypothetical protein